MAKNAKNMKQSQNQSHKQVSGQTNKGQQQRKEVAGNKEHAKHASREENRGLNKRGQ